MLFSPLVIIFVFLLAGWFLSLFLKKTGYAVMSCGMILFIIFGIFPVGPNLMVYLEKQYGQQASLEDDDPDGIVVLGGAFRTDHSVLHDTVVANDNIERVLEAVRLNQVYPRAFLVFSGGNGMADKNLPPESVVAERFMEEMGFSQNTVIYEERSRNTYENAVYTKELVLPLDSEQWVLVTSAYHMPRSVAVFKAAGWDIKPHPTDFRTDMEYSWMPSLTDIHKNLNMADLALHEIGGMFIYNVTGKL